MNCTDVPEGTGLEEAVMEIPATATGFTTIVTVLDDTGPPERHSEFETITQATIFPFSGMQVNVEFVAPGTGVPFRYH